MTQKKRKTYKKKSQKLTKHLNKEIVTLFKNNNTRTLNYKQVASLLEIHDSPSRKLVYQILEDLAQKKQIISVQRGQYRCAPFEEVFIYGTVDAIRNGGAYIVSDDVKEDVYIAPKNMYRALHGDRVKVAFFTRGRRHKPEGKVVEIDAKQKREFVGILEVNQKFAFLKVNHPKVNVDIYIPKEKLQKGKQGDKAIARINDWPEGASSPFGQIVEVLGVPGTNHTEMHAILAEYGLPRTFPENVSAAATQIPLEIPKEEIAKRRDFRNVTTFTIDPEDAKDFDDALSIQKKDNGNWEVGVHIADVAHYVKADSVIDQEATKRATSVYLVDRVIPMLPEVLSNQVCSLRPEEEKCVFSVVFELNEKATIIHEWLGKSVIRSDRRFTYEEAQEIIETQKGDFATEILQLDKLAKIMRKERTQNGAIEFSSSEVRFHLNKDGNPISVHKKEMKDSNRLVEDFMLLANKQVATFVGKPPQSQTPQKARSFVYRIHDLPNAEKLETLAKFVKQFDYKFKPDANPAAAINEMLKAFADRPERSMIEIMSIRSMAKACYTTRNIGHYGLGFDYYTHFTSPIRRYPDLMVHRLLERYLNGANSAKEAPLEVTCKHCSIMEKKATDAERSSIKYMQVQYMTDKVGEVFEGMVSGFNDYGMYVELTDNYCEGRVPFGETDYSFDERNHCVVERGSGVKLYLGDPVTVLVKSADLERKQLEFELAGDIA